MKWAQSKANRWYTHWALWTIVILAAGIFFGWPRLKAHFQRWNAGRQVKNAEQFLAGKDFKRAVMTARSVLAVDPANVGATQIIAKSLEEAGAPEAVTWRSRLDSLEPGNVENTLAWAADAMKAGDTELAERVLKMLTPASMENASYHSTAAQLSMAKRDKAAAEKHWAEAVRLDPKQDRNRLSLAILQMRSQDSKVRAGALAALTELSEKTPGNIEATRILLNEAARLEEWNRAEVISKNLVANPAATFGDKLQRLATLRKIDRRDEPGYFVKMKELPTLRMDTTDAPAYLVELRNGALSKPDDLYTLFMWMNENRLSMLVSEWIRTIPQDVIGAPPVCVAVADAYARSSDWKRLRDFVDEHAWGDLDYLRRVFLSRALERMDEAELSAREWKDGLAAARSREDSAQRLERLARITVTWRWEQRANEVMWMLAGAPGCPRWVLEALWAQAMNRSDTAQLQKIAGLLAKADSKSVAFLKNYALFSLLIRSEDGNPHREAERLFNENPGDASVAMTWGLSLFQRGKIAEAIAVTGSLPSDALQRPQVALYHAIFLTAAGEGGKAAEFLAVAQDWKMFPEEKTMLDRAKTIATKAGGDQEIAASAKALRAAKAARDLEAEKAVVAARAERLAKAAQAAQEAAQGDSEIAASAKALRAAKAARDLEAEKAVEAARAERMAKAAQAAQEAAQEAAQSPAPEKSGGRVPPR